MDTNLRAEPRQVLGKKVKLLRQKGMIPGNIYGNHQDSTPIQLPERLVTMGVARASRSTLFSLATDGGAPDMVLVKGVQRHPTSGRILHIDFQRVAMTEKLKVNVPLSFVGDAPAVKEFQGTLLPSMTTVEVEALPGNLPTSIEVDVSSLATLDDAITVADLQVPAGVEITTPAEELIAKVLPPTVEAEEAAEEAPEAAAEPAAEAEGEQPAEAESETAASE